MDGIIGLEVTQNSRSFAFADEVIARAFSNLKKNRLLRFFMREDTSPNVLFEIRYSL